MTRLEVDILVVAPLAVSVAAFNVSLLYLWRSWRLRREISRTAQAVDRWLRAIDEDKQ